MKQKMSERDQRIRDEYMYHEHMQNDPAWTGKDHDQLINQWMMEEYYQRQIDEADLADHDRDMDSWRCK